MVTLRWVVSGSLGDIQGYTGISFLLSFPSFLYIKRLSASKALNEYPQYCYCGEMNRVKTAGQQPINNPFVYQFTFNSLLSADHFSCINNYLFIIQKNFMRFIKILLHMKMILKHFLCSQNIFNPEKNSLRERNQFYKILQNLFCWIEKKEFH